MARVKTVKKVLFQFKSEPGRQVFLAGTFNRWDPTRTPLAAAGETGFFTVSLDLPKGRHEYKFVVDGEWLVDPTGADSVPNEHGSMNSVIIV